MARIAAARRRCTRHSRRSFRSFFQILSEEIAPETTLTAPVGSAETNRAGLENPTAYSELRPAIKALIESFITNQPPTGSTEVTGPKKAWLKLLKNYMARALKEHGEPAPENKRVSVGKSPEKVLTSPDPNYREKSSCY